MSYYLQKSGNKWKKWTVTDIETGKKIHFGDSRFEDYTQHKDPLRKERYISRHAPRENWNDPQTAGFWARHLLWNKPSLRDSIRDTAKSYRIKILFE